MYKKILLASGGSDHSLAAADHAFGLAKASDDCVVEIVYVADNSKSKADVLQNWNKIGINDIHREKVRPTEEKAELAGVKYEVKILKGEPGPTLVKYINENKFDLVVLGSRGLNTVQEMVLGSVSHKVAKRSECPVMIVKH